jgi:hypothetical protein
MSELITGHYLLEAAAWERLDGLPSAIGWRAYRWAEAGLWLVDTFPGRQPHRYLLGEPIEESECSAAVRSAAPAYGRASELLAELDYEGAEAIGTLNVGLELAGRLGRRVFSFVSDDDTLELSSVCGPGGVERIRHVRRDMDLEFADGRLTVQPLQFEEEDLADEGEAGGVRAVLGRLEGVAVLPQAVEACLTIHGPFYEELERFLGAGHPASGMDVPAEADLELLAEQPGGSKEDDDKG